MTALAVPQTGPSRAVLLARLVIVLIAVAALLSPLYVALRGSAFLNQPPPPFWGVNSGTTAPGTGPAGPAHKTAGFGGC